MLLLPSTSSLAIFTLLLIGNCRSDRRGKVFKKLLQVDGVGGNDPLIDGPEHGRAIPGGEVRGVHIGPDLPLRLPLLNPLRNIAAIDHMGRARLARISDSRPKDSYQRIYIARR